jgi:hypothetical protein
MQFDESDSRRKLVSAESHRFHAAFSETHESFGHLTVRMRVASSQLKMDWSLERHSLGRRGEHAALVAATCPDYASRAVGQLAVF